ncbi:MAG TPA: carbohydrate-binding domain-containing protein [Phycisphaerae bacterium]|nr:carbohydrate-binding domain-containing protein [Phycisphaerae bacterium]
MTYVTSRALSVGRGRLEGRRRRRCGRREFGREFECGWLETRVMLSVTTLSTDLGEVSPGRIFLPGEIVVTGGSTVPVHRYTFTLDAGADVDIVVAIHPEGFGGPPPGYVYMDTPQSDVVIGSAQTDSGGRAEIKRYFGPGNYELNVESLESDETFDLAMNVDGAAGAFAFANSTSDFVNSASATENLGTLPASTATVVNDFVGYLRTSNDPAVDAIDAYRFNNPIFGSLNVKLDQLVADAAGGRVSVNVGLYADFDHDGLFKANELLASATNLSSSGTFTANVNAGPYAVVVTTTLASGTTVMGGSDYRLTLNYTPADNAGNSILNARNIGTLGNSAVPITDYLSAADTADVYRFDTVAGGPFQFHADMSSPGGGVFAYDLVTAPVGRGGGTTLATTTVNGSAPGSLSFLINAPGTYYFEARRVSGEGAYTINLINTTSDRAGNTLGTSRLLTDVFGKATLPDFVGAGDPIDLYKFTLTGTTVVTAGIGAAPSGTSAGVSLIEDLNGNGIIDKGDSVGDAAPGGSAAKSVTRTLGAGTYYVEVFAITGAVSYDLTLEVDNAGSLVNTALPVTLAGGQATVKGYVGPEDTLDVYKFSVTGAVQINALMQFLSKPIELSFAKDLNGDNFISANEVIAHETVTDFEARVKANLPGAGTYEVVVGSGDPDGSNYGMVLATAPVDNAGDTPGEAREVALGSGVQSFSDVVGNFGSVAEANDPDDFYRFTAGSNGPYEFIGQLPAVNGLAVMQLIYDGNGNQQVDAGEIIGQVSSTGVNQGTPPLVTALTLPGDYYVHVLANNATYVLTMQAVSQDGAGNTLGTARALVGGTVSEFVGRIDPDDFYSFTAAGPGELRAVLSGSNSLNSVEIIRDANNNGVVDAGEVLGSTTNYPVSDDVLEGVLLPSAGTYFAHVASNGVESNYTLTLTQSAQGPLAPVTIVAGAPTVIEAENFDLGGEGVAYHDTTAGNAGGVYRTTEGGGAVGVDIFATGDSGGGFRVDNTAAGEFLEYTVNVATTGNYNMDFRVGSTGTGAQFHLEVDGVSVTGEKDMPGQLGGDTFATVTASNVLLAAGPHVLRFVFDKNNTSGAANAGALNFMAIRPSTGTFVVTPGDGSVRRGAEATLSVAWTVPLGDWHFLKTIDVRLTGSDGSVIWVRFNEADETLSLFDAHARRFGPAKKIGSRGHLSNGLIDIDLAETTVAAAGPTSPTVTLNLAFRLSEGVREGAFAVDVAATNDSGFVQPFEAGGTLHVVRAGHHGGRHHGRF